MPTSTLKQLRDIETGARVKRLDARPFDFAFERIGTVVREMVGDDEMLGVQWDGSGCRFQYPGNTEFEIQGRGGAGEKPTGVAPADSKSET